MFSNKTKITFALITFLLGFSPLTQAQNINNDTDIQNAILAHINEYRVEHGMNALKMDSRISQEAKQHSLDMANHKVPFGHTYFHTRVKRLHAQIHNSNAAAENVAYNYKSAQDVVNNWLKSPGHKHNIRGNYNLTGIGVVRDKQGKIYFTQIFLKA